MQVIYWGIAVWAAACTAGVLYARARTILRTLLWVNITGTVTGAVLLAVSLCRAANAPAQTDSADLLAWAQDAFALWLRCGGIFAAVTGGMALLAALIRHTMVRARAIVGCAASWILLMTADAYAIMCTGKTPDPSRWVLYSGAGLALLAMSWGIPDLAARLKTEQTKKKRKK